MQKRRVIFFVTLAAICILGGYPAYRIYRVWQLNSRLEQFMAQQIIVLQENNYNDEWFKARNLVKPTEYFSYRSEAYYIYGNSFINDIDRTYDSYWLSRMDNQRKVSYSEWTKELSKYGDGTLSWSYQIRPVSGATVCVLVTAIPPKSWTGPMHSVTGVSKWSIDTSKNTLQMTPYYNGPCEFRDTELLRTLLFYVQ
ncbi:MAG: hypothetical protein WCA79_13760 [Anaerolineales bacterium]